MQTSLYVVAQEPDDEKVIDSLAAYLRELEDRGRKWIIFLKEFRTPPPLNRKALQFDINFSQVGPENSEAYGEWTHIQNLMGGKYPFNT